MLQIEKGSVNIMEHLYLAHYETDDDYLAHYGILGQKWGVRRYQNSDGTLTPAGYKHYGLNNLKKSKTANLDKWGKSKDSNVLYIAGYSGSGKSTTSIGLAKKGDYVIHLDGYTEQKNSSAQNKQFNKYLDKAVPNWRKMTCTTNKGGNGYLKRYSKEYWDIVDRFREAIEKFGQNEFKNGKRCIVEGVQLADDWFTSDKSYFKNKPIVIMQTNAISSMKRAFNRDGNKIDTIQSAKKYIDRYKIANRQLNNLSDATQARKGLKYLNQFLKKEQDQ